MSDTQKKQSAVIDYPLTESEEQIIKWLRMNGNGRSDWCGTIRYVGGVGIWQMSNHVNAGQVKN